MAVPPWRPGSLGRRCASSLTITCQQAIRADGHGVRAACEAERPPPEGHARSSRRQRHAYVQAKAGHSQSTITDRYIHAAQVLFPGAAEKAEVRMFGVAG